MVVVGLEDQPRVHLHHVITADQRPATAAWQHLALKLRPVEAAAIKMKHASAAIGSIAETAYLNFESEREQKPGVDLQHGGPPDGWQSAKGFYSMSSSPRFLSPSNVFIASNSRFRSTSHGRNSELTSSTK